MHIALFTPAWPLAQYHNGIVTYVHWMRQELLHQGHRVTVFAGVIGSSNDLSGVRLVRRGRLETAIWRLIRRRVSPEKEIYQWASVVARSISSVHRHDPIDIVEMEESFGWFSEVERQTGIPVLVKLHGPAFLSLVEEELEDSIGQSRIAHEGVALGLASAIASPSSHTLEQTLERYRLKPAIQQRVVNPVTAADDLIRWELDTCTRDTLLFVGRFDRRKGGDIVLEAFRILLRQRPGLTLIFVGPDNGLRQADGLRIQLADWVALNFSPEERRRIDYRGRMSNNELPALRASAMVTVIPSRWENQGYAALEAMYQGCPIVASDVGGNPESIIHGHTGLLARNEDPADFAVQIGRLLDDPEAAAAMGSRARAHVRKHHASAKVAQESLELYERVIAQHRRLNDK